MIIEKKSIRVIVAVPAALSSLAVFVLCIYHFVFIDYFTT